MGAYPVLLGNFFRTSTHSGSRRFPLGYSANLLTGVLAVILLVLEESFVTRAGTGDPTWVKETSW